MPRPFDGQRLVAQLGWIGRLQDRGDYRTGGGCRKAFPQTELVRHGGAGAVVRPTVRGECD